MPNVDYLEAEIKRLKEINFLLRNKIENSSDITLKSCPFCNNNPKIYFDIDIFTFPQSVRVVVACKKCDIKKVSSEVRDGSDFNELLEKRLEVISKWNTREGE